MNERGGSKLGSIVLLDELTINQIAAGEVIERPANVVKELVENSIDAGATNVSIEIENGGITYIRITDNGKGIAPDDVELAFERHATSKIRSAQDLIKVSTMGFRGEALASIAAIAKVELVTRTKDQEVGTKIVVEGGDIVSKEECGAPFGTTITIRELFFNTPVRYKFLKKDFTEGGYIETAVERIALINPDISFKLINNRKEVLKTSGSGVMADVVYNVFGKDIAQNLVDVDMEFEGITVSGVVGKPEIARSNRANQLFYVNGRFIKDKTLSAATEEAYRTLIPHGKFGFCILNVKLAPELVDVNVHPAKLEVRFSEEGKVFKAVHYAIKNALLDADLIRDDKRLDGTPNEEDSTFTDTVRINTNYEPVSSNNNLIRLEDLKKERRSLFNLFKGKPETQVSEPKKPENEYVIEVEENEETRSNSIIQKIEAEEKSEVQRHFADAVEIEDPDILENLKVDNITKVNNGEEDAANLQNEETHEEPQNIFEQEMVEKAPIPEYKILGVAFNTYIFVELDDDVYIIDQHAAHERVLFEKIRDNFYKDGGKETQMLLLPDILEVSKKDMHMIRNHIDLFEQAGFAIEEFGENTIKINGVPTICFEMNTKDLFMDILDGIDITNRTNAQDIELKFIATVACKAAVKANMELDMREIRGLMDQLMSIENPFTCPHGRPTAIRISKNEIEKKFERR